MFLVILGSKSEKNEDEEEQSTNNNNIKQQNQIHLYPNPITPYLSNKKSTKSHLMQLQLQQDSKQNEQKGSQFLFHVTILQ